MGWRSSALILAMALFALWWVSVLAVQGVTLFLTHRHLMALVKRAYPADEHCLRETKWLARMLELRRVPDVLLSHEVRSPQVVGFWRPRVLLPAATSMFSDDEWRMMLCHELTHVRRRDLVLGWIPALAERSFFFHPLARLAAREYVLAREAACDAAVLRALAAEPQTYGRLLIRLGVSGPASALSAAGASPSTSMLKRRLEMLHASASLPTGSRRLWLAAVTLALAAVPFQLTARASSFLPAPLAQGQQVLVGSYRQVHGELPRMWVVQLFNVVNDEWLESRPASGVPVHTVPAQRGGLLAGARFGARRGPSDGEVAPQRAIADADRQSSPDATGNTPGDVPQPDNAAPAIDATEFQDYIRETQSTLRVLAEETGGFAIVNMNDALSRRLKELAAQRADAGQTPLSDAVVVLQGAELEKLGAAVQESQALLRKLREVEALNNERLREQVEAATRQQADLEALLRSLEQAIQPGLEPTSQLLREASAQLRQAQAQAREQTPRTPETTEFLRQQLEERLRALLTVYTAKHPVVLQTKTQLEQLKQQSAKLDAAREDVANQRVLLEEARSRLMEAERQLVEALTKATRAARRAAPPASQPPAK
jgi:beta-lactamase regulating signal transducer with metallopeptidase domain